MTHPRWYIVGSNRIYGVPAASVPEFYPDELLEGQRRLSSSTSWASTPVVHVDGERS